MYYVSSIMKVIQKIALAVFKNKKILLVRSEKQADVFYTLGGKIEEGECDLDCLKREIKEEVGCEVDESSINYLVSFEDVAHGKVETLLNIKLYEGKLIGDPKPSSEIAEINYFDSNSDKRYLSEIAQRKIFPYLKMHGYIN